MRLSYQHLKRDILISKLIKTIKENNMWFVKVIKTFGKQICMMRDKTINKYNIKIEDWINNTFSNKDENNVIQYILKKYNKL